MRNSNNLAKIFGLCGLVAASTVTTAEAGGHRGQVQPVYLVPASPVVAYAPPVAYAPAPVAYAPAQPGHFHKFHHWAYPTAYAVPAYAYPTAAAPAATTYTAVTYTAGQAPATAAAPPATTTYQWQLVPVNGNGSTSGAAPGTDSSLPKLTDLTDDQNQKLRSLLKDHLSEISGQSLSQDAKQNSMIDSATSTYADMLGVSATSLTSAQQDNVKSLALAVLKGTANSPSTGNTFDQLGPDGGGAGFRLPAFPSRRPGAVWSFSSRILTAL